MPETCCQCGRAVTPDEIGLTKKLINRGATKWLCYPCLSQRFGVSQEVLLRKVEEFREMGCLLFAPKGN